METRDQLLRAAFGEIHRKGFQAASITSILETTGLTKGALYHHFRTKQALGLAVVDEVIGEYMERTIFRPLRQSHEPVATLLEIIGSMGQSVSEDQIRHGCPANNLMQEMSPLDEDFKQRLNAILTRWCEAIEDALVRGKSQGVVREDVDCSAAALFVVSAWEGCRGIAKNFQSAEALVHCAEQLRAYIVGLTYPSVE